MDRDSEQRDGCTALIQMLVLQMIIVLHTSENGDLEKSQSEMFVKKSCVKLLLGDGFLPCY